MLPFKGALSVSLSVLVPAYDHPTLWEGHSSLIQEISGQLAGSLKPDAIVCAVGGGGLLGGVIKGCETVGWDDGTPKCSGNPRMQELNQIWSQSVPILGMETHLSNCFYLFIIKLFINLVQRLRNIL